MTESILNKLRRLTSWHRLRRGVWLMLHKPREVWLLVRLSFWTMWVTLLMKRVSLPRLLAWLSPRHRKQSQPPSLAPQRAAYWLDRILNLNAWVFTPICWKRALVLHRILGCEGIQTDILFGVRKPSETSKLPLDGHAWLECEGRPLLEKEPPDYVVTYRFPR
jgi:Transglutaminase-like superfamily